MDEHKEDLFLFCPDNEKVISQQDELGDNDATFSCLII